MATTDAKTQAKAEDHITRSAKNFVTQVVYLVNTAPYLTPVPKDDTPHRGNTPWLILVPFLKICFMARNRKGEPICGFFDDLEAMDRARSVIRECVADPEVLSDLQADYRWPRDLGRDSKIMIRTINIEVGPEV